MMARRALQMKSAEIEIPAPVFGQLEVAIVGDSPLIVQRYDGADRTRPLPPKKQFEASRYRFKKGRRMVDGFPTTGVKTAMASAGYRYLGLRSKVSTLGAIFIEGEGPAKDLVEINFEGKKPIMRRDSVWVDRVDLGARCRPSYPKWSMKLVIRYDANTITPQDILYMLNTAGHAVGFGVWRPEKKGQFGTFHVKTTA